MSSAGQSGGDLPQQRLRRPSNMRHTQTESNGLSYHHLSPQIPRPGVPSKANTLQIPEHNGKPSSQRTQELGATTTQAQKDAAQIRPSLLATAKQKIFRLGQREADHSQSPATDEPEKGRHAPGPDASSPRPGSMPVAVGNARQGVALSSSEHRVSGESSTRRASDKAWKKLTKGANAAELGAGTYTAPRKLPFFRQPKPLRKKQSHASLREGLEQTNQTLIGLSSLPAMPTELSYVRKPSTSSSRPEASHRGVEAGQQAQQKRQHRTITTVPESMRPYVTRDRFPLMGSGMEDLPPPSRYTSATFDLYGAGLSQSPQGPFAVPAARPMPYEGRRQSSTALRQYATTPLLSGEGLRRAPPAPQATPLPARATRRLQRPMSLGDGMLQAPMMQRRSAMRKAPVPLYAHQKHVQFYDAPQPPPLVHMSSAPVLRVPLAHPSLQERSASARWHDSSAEYDVHSAVSSNSQRHPSIEHVLKGRSPPTTAGGGSDQFNFTRSERNLPGEARRSASENSNDGAAPGAEAVPLNSTVSAGSQTSFDALSVQRTDSDKYRRSHSYPSASPSRLSELAPTISVPNLRKRNGSISSMDYGRLGVNGITNSMTLIAPPALASAPGPSIQVRVDSAVEFLKDILPPATDEVSHERYCLCETCSPHAEDCVCKTCYGHRLHRVYKACNVYERIESLTSTCERLIPLLAEHAHPNPTDAAAATKLIESLNDFGSVKSFADHIATVPPHDTDSAFHGMPECREEQRFETLMRMIRTWEQFTGEAEDMLQSPETEES
ncbi:hypothetical protein LTR85_000545 [Meristemomyces frigidus]|nr:hypothetical protein LTR85_000545 [Meristemomyces frigidus]